MDTIYLIGAPGSGKTTLSDYFRIGWNQTERNTAPIKHERWQTPDNLNAVTLGWNNPPFSGTDTLGYTAIVQIEQWLPTMYADILYGEGDRLAGDRFFNLARSKGRLHLFYLNTNPAVAADRRAARADAAGTEQQNPSWVAGRITKHRNLAIQHNATEIPHGLTLDQQAALIWETVDSHGVK
jgi:hypothetical protein